MPEGESDAPADAPEDSAFLAFFSFLAFSFFFGVSSVVAVSPDAPELAAGRSLVVPEVPLGVSDLPEVLGLVVVEPEVSPLVPVVVPVVEEPDAPVPLVPEAPDEVSPAPEAPEEGMPLLPAAPESLAPGMLCERVVDDGDVVLLSVPVV